MYFYLNKKNYTEIKMDKPEKYVDNHIITIRDYNDLLHDYFHLLRWKLSGDDIVMDIGSGPGDLTYNLLRPKLPNNAKLYGCDVSEEMLKYAREHYPEVEFVFMDIGALDIPNEWKNSIDHIISSFCLHWIYDQKQLMNNIYNLLQPAGEILVSYIASIPICEILHNFSKTDKWKNYVNFCLPFFQFYKRCEDVEEYLKKVLKEIGFDTLVCVCKEKQYDYKNFNVYFEGIKIIIPFYDDLSDQMKEELDKDYEKELVKLKIIEENFNKSEKFTLPYKLITICARKPN